MSSIESALNDRIDRRSRQQAKALNAKLVAEVKRLRARVASLSDDVDGLKAQLRDLTRTQRRGAEPVATPDTRVRMSPRLIAVLRKRLGVSQPDFARLLDVSPQSVYQWESGRSSPRAAAKSRIASLRNLGRRDAKRMLAEKA